MTDDQPWRYARHSDPETSRRAAERVNLKITDRHLHALGVLLDLDEATDDMIAARLVRDGIVQRHEQGRRIVRTIRDRYDYIEPATDIDGTQLELVNESGNTALAWRLSMHGIQIVLDPTSRKVK